MENARFFQRIVHIERMAFIQLIAVRWLCQALRSSDQTENSTVAFFPNLRYSARNVMKTGKSLIGFIGVCSFGSKPPLPKVGRVILLTFFVVGVFFIGSGLIRADIGFMGGVIPGLGFIGVPMLVLTLRALASKEEAGFQPPPPSGLLPSELDKKARRMHIIASFSTAGVIMFVGLTIVSGNAVGFLHPIIGAAGGAILGLVAASLDSLLRRNK